MALLGSSVTPHFPQPEGQPDQDAYEARESAQEGIPDRKQQGPDPELLTVEHPVDPARQDRAPVAEGQLVEVDPQTDGQGEEGQRAEDGLAGIGESDPDQRQMPQPPHPPHQEVGSGLAQDHQLGQEIAPPAKLLAEPEQSVQERGEDQRGPEQRREHEPREGRAIKMRPGGCADHRQELRQLPIRLTQAEQPGQSVDQDEAEGHEQAGREVWFPGAHAEVRDREPFPGYEPDREHRGQRGHPHHRHDD